MGVREKKEEEFWDVYGQMIYAIDISTSEEEDSWMLARLASELGVWQQGFLEKLETKV